MNVAVFFGGRSSEHDISIITAVQAMHALDKKHVCIPVYIDRNGVWFVGKGFDKLSTFVSFKGGREVHLVPGQQFLMLSNGKKYKKIHVALNCTHGNGGEDGALAGVFELSGIPYSGSNLRASAIGMDKITLKNLFLGANIPITRFLGINKYEFCYELSSVMEKIKNNLSFPIIVKPSNLGSSIGISIARDIVELMECINIAFMWDTRVIIEEALEDFTELNCAVCGFGGQYLVSEVEQPVGWKSFLSFEDKYEGGFKGLSNRKFPADIDEETRGLIRELTLKVFRLIDGAGVARVDFLLKDGTIFVNEINTIPGSLAGYLFKLNHLSFTSLIERLISYAIKAHADKASLKYTFEGKNLLHEKNSSLKNSSLKTL